MVWHLLSLTGLEQCHQPGARYIVFYFVWFNSDGTVILEFGVSMCISSWNHAGKSDQLPPIATDSSCWSRSLCSQILGQVWKSRFWWFQRNCADSCGSFASFQEKGACSPVQHMQFNLWDQVRWARWRPVIGEDHFCSCFCQILTFEEVEKRPHDKIQPGATYLLWEYFRSLGIAKRALSSLASNRNLTHLDRVDVPHGRLFEVD